MRALRDWLRYPLIAALPLAFVYIRVRAPIVFHGVEIGMSRAEVIEHLGNSVRTEREMIFCAQYFPWSGACPRASQISEFFFYKFGIDR